MQECDHIVEDYENHQEKPKNNRARFNFNDIMAPESPHNSIPSRNSSLSSRENKPDFI